LCDLIRTSYKFIKCMKILHSQDDINREAARGEALLLLNLEGRVTGVCSHVGMVEEVVLRAGW
jgi:hypothetical protein